MPFSALRHSRSVVLVSIGPELQDRGRQVAQPEQVHQQPFEPRVGQGARSLGVLQDAQEHARPGWPGPPKAFESLFDQAHRVSQTQRRVERLLDPFAAAHTTQLHQRAGDAGAPDPVDLDQVDLVGVPPTVHDRVGEVVVDMPRQADLDDAWTAAVQTQQGRRRPVGRCSPRRAVDHEGLFPRSFVRGKGEDVCNRTVEFTALDRSSEPAILDSVGGSLVSMKDAVARGCELDNGAPSVVCLHTRHSADAL